MSIDVYGRNPTGERGKYFGNGAATWGPLACYCQQVAPEITSACRHWYTNDGDGLDAAGALALAEALEQEINTSRIHAHARRYAAEQELIAAEQELMPDKLCVSCGGSGLRKSAHARLHGGGVLKPGMIICNQCEGAGYVRPITGCLEFTTENVAAFVAFLRECGGFEIC